MQINGEDKISSIKELSFDGKRLDTFTYKNKLVALYGIDLRKKPGEYELKMEMVDGDIIKNIVNVGKREIVEEKLGIPEKLGGNTKASQEKLIATLIRDKKKVTGLVTEDKPTWNDKFIFPLKEIFITTPYGYSRKTGAYSIAHKGADYRAPEGTDVIAVNRGIVRIARSFRNYGKSIFIDHGLGLVTSYMHLSKINVKAGDTVELGQVIGLSGHTGYSVGPHLHLGVRINEIAIDPVKFFDLFN